MTFQLVPTGVDVTVITVAFLADRTTAPCENCL